MEFYIDIETLPGAERTKPEDIEAPKNYKNTQVIKKYQEENAEKVYRAQALDSMQGRILSIGWAFQLEEPLALISGNEYCENEYELLTKFQNLLTLHRMDRSDVSWIGHNIRTFDLPWLWRKALQYRLFQLASIIPRGKFDKRIVDTMELWASEYRERVSLNNIAKFLGLTGKTSGMDGSKIYDFWLENKLDEIKEYCRQDVDTVRRVYRIISLEDIGLEKVFYDINETALQAE